MAVINRNGEIFQVKENSKFFSQERVLKILYNTFPGRCLLKFLTIPSLSKAVGRYMDSECSAHLIKKFVRNNNIDLSEYQMDNVKTYNEFFTRKIKPDMRKPDIDPKSLISPCDSKLSAYKINGDSVFKIKDSLYSVADMLENSKLAKNFENGWCLIFRLEVTDYHRYCYFDSGVKSENFHIKGELHTVNPIATEAGVNVYKRNSREYTLMRTDNFGDAVQIEVGAMLVGKIKNHHGKYRFSKGEEKGMFLFGGSTVVVLLKKDSAVIDKDIIENTKNGFETIVKYGEKIGVSC